MSDKCRHIHRLSASWELTVFSSSCPSLFWNNFSLTSFTVDLLTKNRSLNLLSPSCIWPSTSLRNHLTGSSRSDVIISSELAKTTFARWVYSARFFANTADTLLTIPRTPAMLFLIARVSFTRSTRRWNTSRTPWYVSAADTSKKPQCWDRASSRPSSPETLRCRCRSRLFATMMMGTEDGFLLRRICCSCCWTTSKLLRSHML